ncbi:GNAT family N-acetyltransferase [Pararoseomonas sp. SCSIO 73927]|uniref:GNAT family N-acetyltransferase n=1 Tax=Pararoseomonas sp. SCSIO 73927 TaxID=3114537 RepID=UPI0030D5532A
MTNAPPPLRPAGEADIPVMAALHAAAFPPAERWGGTALTAMLRLQGGFGLLAGESGFVLARAVAGEAEILTLAVHPGTRRQGLGARLLEAAVAEAARRGAAALFLEVSERNGPARALYARAGATEVGRRRRYYADGTDALVLRIGPEN